MEQKKASLVGFPSVERTREFVLRNLKLTPERTNRRPLGIVSAKPLDFMVQRKWLELDTPTSLVLVR